MDSLDDKDFNDIKINVFCLFFQRRTGVKSEDVDDFVRKADDIQSAIAAMMRGEISPDQVKIQGIDTPEEKAEKEVSL